MARLKIGILSTANIAVRSVIPAIIDLTEHFELAGIASRDFNKAKILSEKYGCEPFESYEALLNSNCIDAVYIPLPNSLHFEFVSKALKAGLHVLVEKSLGCSLAEVTELVHLAQETNLVLIENFQFRFHSQLKYLIQTLNQGKIGNLRMFKATFGFPPFPEKTNIRYQKSLGGGALLDAAAYTTKISQIIFGHNLKVKAATLNFTEGSEVDIWGGAYLEESSEGIPIVLGFGFDNYYQCGVEIWGSKGKIVTNRLFTAPSNYTPVYFLDLNGTTETIKLAPDNHFQNMLLHFNECVRNKDLRMLEGKQNLNQADLLHQIKLKSNKANEA